MKEQLEILNHSFKEVEAPDHLYGEILAKIEAKKTKTISPTWVKLSAIAATFLIILNFYSIKQNTSSSEKDQVSSILQTNNIQLYNE